MSANSLQSTIGIIRNRLGSILRIWIGLCITLSVFIRIYSPPFDVEINFALDNPTNIQNAMPMGFFKKLDLETQIMPYRTLLHSLEMYQNVSDFQTEADELPPILRRISEMIEAAKDSLFGPQFTEKLKNFTNPEWRKIKSKISFIPEFEHAGFAIKCRDKDPQKSLDLCSRVSDSLIKMDDERYRRKIEETIANLSHQISENSAKLADASQAIVNFSEKNKIYSGLEELARKIESLAEIDLEIMKLNATRSYTRTLSEKTFEQYKATSERLLGSRQQLEGKTQDVNPIEIDTQLNRLTYEDLQAQSVLRSGEAHIEFQLKSTEASEMAREFKTIATKLKRDISRYPHLQNEMTQLVTRHTQVQKMQEALLQAYLQSVVQRDSAQHARIVQLSSPATSAAGLLAEKQKSLLGGIVFFLVLSIIVVVLSAHANKLIVSYEQIQRLSSKERIVKFPFVKNSRRRSGVLKSVLDHNSHKIAHLLKPMISRRNSEIFYLTVTSSKPEDGKSIIATSLAFAFADLEYDAMLLDCDTHALTRNSTTYALECLNSPVSKRSSHPFIHKIGPDFDYRNIDDLVEDSFRSSTLANKISRESTRKPKVVILDCPPLDLPEVAQLVSASNACIFVMQMCTLSEDQLEERLVRIKNYSAKTEFETLIAVNFSPEVDSQLLGYRFYETRRKAA